MKFGKHNLPAMPKVADFFKRTKDEAQRLKLRLVLLAACGASLLVAALLSLVLGRQSAVLFFVGGFFTSGIVYLVLVRKTTTSDKTTLN